ncbi:MATE family efflux transporter, partial [Vibrio parahaemolyticus]|nr:MATE family efflux transporter [Vibrio parahaemolyticus]MDG2684088.1 MATE family efflux transporter [Vibrio parahaemolyticus]
PAAWVGSQVYSIEGLFIGIALGNTLGGLLGYMFALRERKLTLIEQNSAS